MKNLPVLIFSADAEVFSERNLRALLPVECTDRDLTERFLHSLKSGDKLSFRRFCLLDFAGDDSANYIIYPLIGKKWLPFRFAFCEKILLDGIPASAAFFANRMDEFHVLMSPASPICRDTSGKLISDLLSLRLERLTFITPETLFLLNDFPLLAQSARSGETDIRCDLLRMTQMIFDGLAEAPPFSDLKFTMELLPGMAFGRPENQIIVPCPTEAYIYLVTLVGYILSVLSDDSQIRGQIRYLGGGAEVSLAVRTSHPNILRGGCSNFEDLFSESHNLSSLARAASAIAHSFGLLSDLSVNAETGFLTAYIGVGMEKFLPNEFRFSDPYSVIPAVLAEVLQLIA